jgi:hypothetical protein
MLLLGTIGLFPKGQRDPSCYWLGGVVWLKCIVVVEHVAARQQMHCDYLKDHWR